MTRADLIALATRVEKAEGPDRDIDAAIMRLFTNSVESDDGEWWYGPHDEPPRKVPAYTASLDAALTLVPEGWGWRAISHPKQNRHWFAVGGGREPYGTATAATPALALVAAALRARAEGGSDE